VNRTVLAALLVFASSWGSAHAQQSGDPAFQPIVPSPAYDSSSSPLVAVDAAHNNFHTIDARYEPFAKLLRFDGYRVTPFTDAFRHGTLDTVDVLVIANALADRNVDDWSLPTPSALTRHEIEAVRAWVAQGGSLLLIADHMPFPGAAADLATAFGFRFTNGYAIDTVSRGFLTFRRADGSLGAHPVTNGRAEGERVDSVRTFTGQAFQGPPDASPLLVLPRHVVSFMTETAGQLDSTTTLLPAAGSWQGAVRELGSGRVAVFGEAAMFTSQVVGSGGTSIGMGAPGARQNQQLLLNLMHWLSGLPGYQ
jgi:hypothetical protein